MKGRPMDDLVLERLKLWTEQLMRIRVREDSYRCELADMGIVQQNPVIIHPEDRPQVIRVKEKLLTQIALKEQIARDMVKAGAVLVDEVHWEVLLPGGPDVGGYLSWMPGEPVLAWRREKREPPSPRLRLRETNAAESEPTSH